MEPIIYRASSLGGCTKAQIAQRLGYDPLPHSQGTEAIFREGNLHEDDVVAQLTEQGYSIYDQQAEVTLGIFGAVSVVGHIDGRIEAGFLQGWKAPRLLEIKSMAQDSFDAVVAKGWAAGGLMPKYKWQISAYMLATGLEGMLVVKNRNRGGLHVLYSELPFHSLADIKARVIGMEAAVARGELPIDCDVSNYPCPYRYLHEEVEAEVLDDAAITTLATMYKDAQVVEKAATDKVKLARRALKNALMGMKKLETSDGKIRINVYSAKNPPTWDIPGMVKDGIEVDKYRNQTTSERMRVDIARENPGQDSPGPRASD